MDAMLFLSRPSLALNRLRRAEEKRDSLKALTERVTTKFGIEAEPVAHTRNPAAMQDAIILLSEAEEEVNRLRQELGTVELEVGVVLVKLQDKTLYDFMVARFLDLKTIVEAADQVGYSYSWGRMAQRRGIAEVQAILNLMEARGKLPGFRQVK